MSKVISPRLLPTRLPLSFTLSTLIALDYWNVPDIFCGIFYFMLAILWVVIIYGIYDDEHTQIKDLIYDNPPAPPIVKKSGFQSKLDDAIRAQQDIKDKY